MKNVILLIGLIFSTIVNGQELTDAQYQTLLGRNILKNASFANGKTSWYLSGGTSSVSTTSVDDSKSLSMVSSAQTLDVLQSVTTNATNLANLQGVARVYVKSNFSNTLQVCSYVNGANQSCVNVLTDNSWRLYEIPTILGATSSGVRIVASGSGSGTTLIDNAFVGTSAPFQNVSGAKLLGTLKYAGTNLCEWQLTSSTFANFSADTDCSTPTVTGSISAPGTKIPAIVLPSGSPAGTYFFVAKGMFYNASGNYGTWRFSDGTNSSDGNVGYQNTNSLGSIVGSITYSSSLSSATTVNIQNKNNGGASYITANTTSDGLGIEVYYYPPESRIYSQASQDYDWTAFTATSPNSSFTISSSECFKKREGSDLLVRCKITSSAGAAIEGRIALPDSLASANSSIIPSLQIIGQMEVNSIGSVGQTVGSSYGVYIEPSVGYFTFGGRSSGSTGLVKQTAANIAAATTFSFYARVPIQGWTDYGVIVGSFKDYVSTPTGGRVETFSFGFGTTATTSCNASPCAYLDQIGNLITSVTRASAGNYTINFSKTYTKVKCSYPPTSSGATNMSLNNSRMSCENCSSFSFTTVNGSGTSTDAHGTMYCQGQL